MFAKFTVRQSIRSFLGWILQFLRFIFRKHKRFVCLTPPFLRTQIFYDAFNTRFVSIRIRNWTDWRTSVHVFCRSDYGLEKLSRFSDIAKYYAELTANGLTPLIIDCGGNIGLGTRFFRETYPASHIVCIEPDHDNISQAKLNNSRSASAFIEAAIGSSDTRGTIIDPGLAMMLIVLVTMPTGLFRYCRLIHSKTACQREYAKLRHEDRY